MSGDVIGAQVAKRAAEIIRDRGWHQGNMEYKGRVCAARALILAGREFGDSEDITAASAGHYRDGLRWTRERLDEHHDLRQRARPYTGSHTYVTEWNDHADTTESEVLAILEGR